MDKKILLLVGCFALSMWIGEAIFAEEVGLVSLWHMDEEETATKISDETGNNPGTIYGAIPGAKGIKGKSITFDGKDDYIRIEDSPNLNIRDKITLEAWVYPQEKKGEQIIILKYPAYCLFYQTDNRNIWFDLWDSNGKRNRHATSSGAFNLNKWNHIVATYDGRNKKIYVNGELKLNAKSSLKINVSNNDLAIGGNYIGRSGYLKGIIDEVAIYNKALTEEEITKHYKRGIPIGVIIPQKEKEKEIGNLVLNSSFEIDPVGYKGSPKYWSGITHSDKYVSIVADSPMREFGEKCVQIDYAKFIKDTGKKRPCKWMISQMIPIKDNQKYIQSCWIKTDGFAENRLGVTVGRAYFNKDKKPIMGSAFNGQYYSYMVHNAGPKEWTYYKQVLIPDPTPDDGKWESNEIPKGACYLQIWAGGFTYPFRVWFDGLRVEPYRESSGTLEIGDKKIYQAKEIKETPLIDGELSEDIWKEEGDWADNFCRTICPLKEVKVAADQTRFKVLYDKDYIYFGIICDESEPSKIKTRKRKHNDPSIWADDAIEIYLDPTYQKKTYFYFVVNAGGSVGEEFAKVPITTGIETATKLIDTGWQAEIKIPKEGLRERLFAVSNDTLNDKIWYMNITRHQPGDGKDRFTSWGYTSERSFHNVNTLGSLLFTEPKEVLIENFSLRNTYLQDILSRKKYLLQSTSDTPLRVKEVQNEVKEIIKSYNTLLIDIKKAPKISFSDFARLNRESLRTIFLIEEKLHSLEKLCIEIPEERKEYGYVIYSIPLFERPD